MGIDKRPPGTSTGQPPEPGEPGNQVESLADIAALGAAVDAPALMPAEAANDAKAEANEIAQIAAALELLRASAIPFAPDHVQKPLELLWNDDQLERVAKAIIQVCQHHGLTMGEFFERYGPYIQLCGVLLMPALATLKLLKMPPPQNAPKDGQQQPA